MAISSPVSRRTPADRNTSGANFDLKKMKRDLRSEIIDLPKNQNVEERSLWLWEMMQKRKTKA